VTMNKNIHCKCKYCACWTD